MLKVCKALDFRHSETVTVRVLIRAALGVPTVLVLQFPFKPLAPASPSIRKDFDIFFEKKRD